MIRNYLLSLSLILAASGAMAQNHADGDSIVPPGDAKYKTGVYYRITSLNFHTLELAGFMSGQDRDSINVPKTVLDSVTGVEYTVTSVAPDAFKDKKILKHVTLPVTITRIGARCFKGCSLEKAVIPGSDYHVETEAYADNPLKEVYINSPGTDGSYDNDHSVELQDKAFGSEDGNMTDVYISYKKPPIVADDAKPFPQESARKGSAVLHLPEGADVQAYRDAHCWGDFFAVETAVTDIEDDFDSNAPAVYYTLQGVTVNRDRLTPGIYIVRQGNKTSKILIN